MNSSTLKIRDSPFYNIKARNDINLLPYLQNVLQLCR